jgi:RNA polymerase sigma factor (TIGR02999 family)
MANGAVTRELQALSQGDDSAWTQLIQLVYGDLRRLASNHLRREAGGHTLQPTALVHEAWLRLRKQRTEWHDRAHFLALASQLMRLILVDHARSAHRLKRREVPGILWSPDAPEIVEVLALHDGLTELARLSARQSRVVELRFFGGLTFDEIAEVTGCAVRTVKSDWSMARAWLHAWLRGRPIAH